MFPDTNFFKAFKEKNFVYIWNSDCIDRKRGDMMGGRT